MFLPLVSIIIPTYQRARFLVRAIESVLKQTYPRIELIVVDDGSKDETPHIVCRYPLKYVKLPKNFGVSFARNRGILKAKGDFIAFLDSDDMFRRKKVEKQVEFFLKNPHFMAVQTEEVWFRHGRGINPRKRHVKARGYFLDRALDLCVVSPSSVMLRREVFAHLGLFDEGLPVCEDYDYFIRYALKYPMGYIPEPLVVKEGGHEGQLSSRWGLDFYRVKSLIKNYLKHLPLLAAEEKILFLYYIHKKAKIFLEGARKRGNLKGLFEMQRMLSCLEFPHKLPY